MGDRRRGRGMAYTGIRPKGDNIQIRFSWNGQRHEPIWPHKPTAANLKAASSIRAEIAHKAKYNTLTWHDLAQYFPQYRPETISASSPTFGELAQIYLDMAEVSINTRTEYRKTLMRYWMPHFAIRPIDSITATELRRLVAGIDWSSAKTRNNSLIPLRGVFDIAVEDEWIERNPASNIKNLKHQKPPIEPFTQDEVRAILGDLYGRYKGRESIYALYFDLAFWTGLRTSELIALRWDDVDFNQRTIRVDKAQSKGRLNATTKTGKSREVLLNDNAYTALIKAKALTFLQGEQVIISPALGTGWNTDKSPRKILTACMKRLGIKHRPTYNTRHTYATVCLMSGMNPSFVANQLGHSVQVLLSTYAKWIHGDESKKELEKLNGSGMGLAEKADL